jgi:signal transduction histidine kinase
VAEPAGPHRDDVGGPRGGLSDRIANRALVFLALTAVGVAVYALCLTVVVPRVPAQTAGTVLTVAALAAVLLLARDRAQRAVDWLLYGDRRDPERAIVRVGRRVESATDPATLVDALAETLAAALRLSYVEVRLADGPADCRVGTPTRRVTDLDLVHQGRTLGTLRAGRKGEALSRADVQVLAAVAPQLAAAAETVRLQQSLARARERVVRAREEERRRLRRDLHDVLGPALAGVGLGLDAVRIRAQRDPAGADALIAQVQDEVRACVGEIRKIIEGLRPPVLDERGLLGALQQHAGLIADRADLRVTVEGADLPPLPAAVEVVAYLIGQEALTNAVRHAAARQISVAVSAGGSDLVLEVRDDGSGLPEQRRRGVGLLSMAERAEEIGGDLVVAGEAPRGTRVRVRLPLLPPEPADDEVPVAVVEGRR